MAYGRAERDPENLGEVLVSFHFDKYGVSVPVHVNNEGVFSTQLAGEDFAANELDSLKSQVHTYLRSAQKAVPFISAASGRRGVIRAFHKTSRDMLVTWGGNTGGIKGKIDTYTKVLPGDTPEDVRQQIIDASEKLRVAKAHYDEVQKSVGSVNAEELFMSAVGEDLTSHRADVAELDPDGVPVVGGAA